MLRRLIHNSLQTLKKDNGAHFTYNIGVGFVRLGVGLLLIAAVIFGLGCLDIGNDLKYIGQTKAEITDLRSKYYYSRNPRSDGYTRYMAKFSFDIGDTHYDTSQYITFEDYSSYKQLRDLDSITMNVYRADDMIYLSAYDLKTANKRYREANPVKGFGETAVFICYFAIPIWLIGLGQERLAMKYPRNDVEVNGTDIVTEEDAAETEELLKEFDEAFEKFQQNKAAGLPTSVPPRTDGKYRLEQHRDNDVK